MLFQEINNEKQGEKRKTGKKMKNINRLKQHVVKLRLLSNLEKLHL